MNRRVLLASGVALTFPPSIVRAAALLGENLELSGTMDQGSLVIGRCKKSARVSVDGKETLVSGEGVFAFGFDWDQTKPAHLELSFADGTSDARDVVPIVRQYEIQRINGLPEKYVTPSPEDLERIKREHEAVAKARTLDSDNLGFASPFAWPAKGIISGVFGSQRILNGQAMSPHFGVDIAAPVGTDIHAPAIGTVSLTGDYDLEGGFTLIDHGHGVSTCYLHQSKRLVQQGDAVAAGQKIGEVGQTGRATGPHLHWGMNIFQVRLDPSRSTATPEPPKS